MRKQLLLVGITIMLLTIGLSGCTQETTISGEMKKFIGTWNADETDVFIFSADGSCAYTVFETPGSYAINNSKLVVILQTGTTYTYTYEFSDSDTTLALTNADTGVTTTYTKQ